MKRSVVWILSCLCTAAAAPAATPEDVGDADSFGHTVVYLGFRQSTPITLSATCDGADPALGRCIAIVPGGTTRFNESNLGIFRLPARSTRTLICHAVTPLYARNHFNPAETADQAEFQETAVFTVESPVLNDPTLINRVTGQPFGGAIVIGTTNISEQHPLAAESFEFEQASNTKLCGAGLVSRQQLIQLFGLPPALATQFFQRPITIRMGVSGRARLTTGLQFFYLVRLFGDQ
jgi:hypothetical protein